MNTRRLAVPGEGLLHVGLRWLAQLGLLLAALGVDALAMTLEVHGERIFATGPIGEPGDLERFSEALKTPGIQEIVLVNSPGGQLRAAMSIARLIVPRKLRTVVVGRCMSACSVLFLAGEQRQFGSGANPLATMVGIHGAHRRSTREVDPALQPQLYAYYKQRLGSRFDELVISQALYGITDAGGFLRMRELQRNKESLQTAFFCAATNTLRNDCVSHEGKNAFNLGVVTSVETAAIVLPEAFKPRFVFFGRTLEQEAANPVDVIITAAAGMCRRSARCSSQVAEGAVKWLEQVEAKAFALGVSRAGYAWRSGSTTPVLAAAHALYACNHDKDSPKLCRLALADRYDLNGFYLESEQQSIEALGQLRAPTQPTWADEERDDGIAAPAGLRSSETQGATPRALEAIQTIDTGALASRLLASTRPMLIDVDIAGRDMLPGAVFFWNGGLALTEEKAEASYDERFRTMLALVAADRDRPLVFYCGSATCWLSANAAMRAARAGYRNVAWYRGGLASWRAAGLPVVQKVPSAILN